MKEIIMEIERYAVEENIPIMEKDSISFIMKYIKTNNIKTILEIGGSIGYSSILMANALEGSNASITTIEPDSEDYMECLKNVKKCGLDKKINVVCQDALDLNLVGVEYDLILLDASNGKFIDLFEKFQYFVSDEGVIITDNLKPLHLMNKKSKLDKEDIADLTEKIEGYITFLKDNENFTTKFYDIGDGLSVSTKKGNEDSI